MSKIDNNDITHEGLKACGLPPENAPQLGTCEFNDTHEYRAHPQETWCNGWKPVAAPESRPRTNEQETVTCRKHAGIHTRTPDCECLIFTKAREAHGEVPQPDTVAGKDWDSLLLEIAHVYALINDEWADADLGEMDEFDPWHALREIDKQMRSRIEPGAHPPPDEPAERDAAWEDYRRRGGVMTFREAFDAGWRARAPQVWNGSFCKHGKLCELCREEGSEKERATVQTNGVNTIQEKTDYLRASGTPKLENNAKGTDDGNLGICDAMFSSSNHDSNSARIGESEQTTPVAPSKLSAQESPEEMWKAWPHDENVEKLTLEWADLMDRDVCAFARKYASSSNAVLLQELERRDPTREAATALLVERAETAEATVERLQEALQLDVDAIRRVATGELDRGTPEQRFKYIEETCKIVARMAMGDPKV